MPYELRALSMFGEQGAVAIANARLFDAERAHVVELVELDRLKFEFLGLVTHELERRSRSCWPRRRPASSRNRRSSRRSSSR